MRLNFKYNIEKDAENFKIVRTRPSKICQLYIEKYGENFIIDKIISFIEEYLENHKINIEAEIKTIKQRWSTVNDIFFKRADEIFGTKLPFNFIDVYLTINDACSYNIDKKYFFVSFQKNHQI